MSNRTLCQSPVAVDRIVCGSCSRSTTLLATCQRQQGSPRGHKDQTVHLPFHLKTESVTSPKQPRVTQTLGS